MEGRELYNRFVQLVTDHELRGATFGPGEIPSWEYLRPRSKAVWVEFANTSGAWEFLSELIEDPS